MKGMAAFIAGTLLLLATEYAQASYITLSTTDLLLAEAVQTNTDASNRGDFQVVNFSPPGVLFTQNMSRPWSAGEDPFYVYCYIGVDADLVGKSDLTGVDSFELQLANVNNSPWELALFVQAAGQAHLTEYQAIQNHRTPLFEHFAFDLASLGSDASEIEFLGLAVRSLLTGNPSNPDAYHVMAAPVPEPGTVLLLGLGCFCLAIYGKRRKNA
ncbi:PEP-CTERM sorting domain-containing protein [Geomonas diazotrophica]|uniref:PEP-CTERM sorting domain-containing protein n=1 Tax=Geomonas diazotrophica TaxID=2843197 RepID=UPI001EF012A6|nr:PEP-CTERM sorting domain-containing protein [Geomonas nitrogeniifigens]